GARSKGDGETAIGLWRRNMLPSCRLADIPDPVCHFRWAPPHVNIPCPTARLLTHLASDHYLLLRTTTITFADLSITASEVNTVRDAYAVRVPHPSRFSMDGRHGPEPHFGDALPRYLGTVATHPSTPAKSGAASAVV